MIFHPLARRLARTIAWRYPGLHLRLTIKLRLERSEYFKLSQQCRTYEPGSLTSHPLNTAVSHPRKRILFAIHWYELSGAELFALYCMRTARELGHFCHCVSTVPSDNPEKEVFSQYCVEVLDTNDFSSESGFLQFISDYIAEHSIDVIHIHHSVLMYEALPELRKRFPGLHVVDTTHIIEYSNGGFPQISAKCSPNIDVHNVASHGLMRAQQEMYRRAFRKELDSRKFSLTYTSSLTAAREFRHRADSESPKVVTFYGRFAAQKQPWVFVATIERLVEQNPNLNVEAHFYGTGEMQSDLQRRISRSKFKHHFRLLGRNDDKSEVFGRTDILFLSSINEGLSFTSFEALIYDRLVVCADVGDQGELVARECLVPLTPGFIEEAAERLGMFLTDNEKYARALARSKANLEKIRSREVSPARIEALYTMEKP